MLGLFYKPQKVIDRVFIVYTCFHYNYLYITHVSIIIIQFLQVFILINFGCAHQSIIVYDSYITFTSSHEGLAHQMHLYTTFILELLVPTSFQSIASHTTQQDHLALCQTKDVFQQGVGFGDCGVFMLHFIECITLEQSLDFPPSFPPQCTGVWP